MRSNGKGEVEPAENFSSLSTWVHIPLPIAAPFFCMVGDVVPDPAIPIESGRLLVRCRRGCRQIRRI
ncbi:hypothetical protein DAI22_10g113200 [Oryza sativa Japonica Group]|nr:hypothetical protein DAI22_10g113200 [Oryza sativa Japonica Group]